MNSAELADMAGVGVRSIRRAEEGDGPMGVSQEVAALIVAALETRGISFIIERSVVGVTVRRATRFRA